MTYCRAAAFSKPHPRMEKHSGKLQYWLAGDDTIESALPAQQASAACITSEELGENVESSCIS